MRTGSQDPPTFMESHGPGRLDQAAKVVAVKATVGLRYEHYELIVGALRYDLVLGSTSGKPEVPTRATPRS